MKLTWIAALMFGFAVIVAGCEKKTEGGGDTAAAGDTAKPADEGGGGDGGGCDKYQKCCDALSKMEGMSAMTAACANIAQLKEAPNGNEACDQAVKALASVPNLPDECK